jgi:hypothetical protein
MRQHTHMVLPFSLVGMRQHTAYVSIREHAAAYAPVVALCARSTTSSSALLHTSAYDVSIRQHTSAYVSIRQHTPFALAARPPPPPILQYEDTVNIHLIMNIHSTWRCGRPGEMNYIRDTTHELYTRIIHLRPT